MSVIGIDLGISKIALMDVNEMDALSYQADSDQRDLELRELASVAHIFVQSHDGASVWIEDTIVGNNRKYSIGLAETKGAVLAALAGLRIAAGVDVRLVDNKVWKKQVIGNGNANKDDIKNYIHVTHGAYAPLCGDDQDLYDATCIGLYGRLIMDRAAGLRLS